MENKEQKPVTFADLIDECIKLLETPDKVDVFHGRVLDSFYVFPYEKKTVFSNEIFSVTKHKISYTVIIGGNSYNTEDFGEIDRVKKLYELCSEKYKETSMRMAKKEIARKQGELGKYVQTVKQYM